MTFLDLFFKRQITTHQVLDMHAVKGNDCGFEIGRLRLKEGTKVKYLCKVQS